VGRLFVGGISWLTTEDELKTHFNKYGTVVAGQVMMDRQTGKSRGFGFVEFSASTDIDPILRERHVINEKVCDVKSAVDRETAPPSIHMGMGGAVVGGQGEEHKIFVGNLKAEVNSDYLKTYFEEKSER